MKKTRRVFGMGDRFREACNLSGKTYSQIIRETGSTRSSFYRHLDGYQMETLALAKYCLALNVSADWLLGIKEDPTR